MAEEDPMRLAPETLAAMQELAEQTAADRAHGRTASEAINEDAGPRPYSVRLSAREIHRLRLLAGSSGMKPSELARQFILDGLLRQEAKLTAAPADKEQKRILDIKLALLNAYHLVDSLDVEAPPSLPPTTRRRKQA